MKLSLSLLISLSIGLGCIACNSSSTGQSTPSLDNSEIDNGRWSVTGVDAQAVTLNINGTERKAPWCGIMINSTPETQNYLQKLVGQEILYESGIIYINIPGENVHLGYEMVRGGHATVNEETVEQCEKGFILQSAAKETAQNVTKHYTQADYDAITEGMTLEDVEQILGKGHLQGTSDATYVYLWDDPAHGIYISVSIREGKVVEKNQKGLD